MGGLAVLCLIVLGESLSDVSRSKPHDWILSRVVVWRASENLNSDHALSQRVFPAGQTVFDDVPKQVLTLPAGTKRCAAKDVC
jgi:hypothetical protein